MGFSCGIVGLPNVGKSTLFNALTATQAAEARNYPFCTIEPNIGRVAVPHVRLYTIHEITGSPKSVAAQIDFVDIAGLVRGASKGEGLGNKFLSHIREVDAIAHVLRCFEDSEISHVEASIDPVRDAETVETELMLADMESLERREKPLSKRAKGGDKEAKAMLAAMQPALAALGQGKPAREAEIPADLAREFRMLQLLSAKPVLYVANVEEAAAATGNAFSERLMAKAREEGAQCVVVSAAIESEIAQLADDAEKREFLEALGLEEPGLDRIKRAGYELLGLITYFTSGPTETRAWTVQRGTRAQDAAGIIHTDFARGFICAETIAYDDFVACGGEQGAKDAGKMRQEGKDYIVKDGDVILFRFNV